MYILHTSQNKADGTSITAVTVAELYLVLLQIPGTQTFIHACSKLLPRNIEMLQLHHTVLCHVSNQDSCTCVHFNVCLFVYHFYCIPSKFTYIILVTLSIWQIGTLCVCVSTCQFVYGQWCQIDIYCISVCW